MEPIQDDIETVRQALHDFGDDTQVMVDGEAALDRLVAERDAWKVEALHHNEREQELVAERDRLNTQVDELVEGINKVIEERDTRERWYEEAKAERDRLSSTIDSMVAAGPASDEAREMFLDEHKRVLTLEAERDLVRHNLELANDTATMLIEQRDALEAERDRLRELLAKEHGVEDGVSHERDAEYPDEICDLLFGALTTEERPMLAPTPEAKAAYLRQQSGPTVDLADETTEEQG